MISFYETIRKPAEAEGKHVHTRGPEHEYAHVRLRVEPLANGTGVKIEAIKTQEFPDRFFPDVEQGILRVIATGVLARCEMTDLKVEVTGGSYHAEDSTPEAFEKAAEIATCNVLLAAEPYLLEPVCTINIEAPDEFLGSLLGLLNSKRGRIENLEAAKSREGFQVITALLPQMELIDLMSSVPALTQRRATCTHAFALYDQLPKGIAKALIHRCTRCKQCVIPVQPRRTCPNCGSQFGSDDGPMVSE